MSTDSCSRSGSGGGGAVVGLGVGLGLAFDVFFDMDCFGFVDEFDFGVFLGVVFFVVLVFFVPAFLERVFFGFDLFVLDFGFFCFEDATSV